MKWQQGRLRLDAANGLDGGVTMQLKVWLLGISPMVWRRLQVPAECSLRELQGVIQVAIG